MLAQACGLTDITTSPASTTMLIRIPTMAIHAGSLTASVCIGADAGFAAEEFQTPWCRLACWQPLPLSVHRAIERRTDRGAVDKRLFFIDALARWRIAGRPSL